MASSVAIFFSMRIAESGPSRVRTSQKTLWAQGVDPHTAVGAPSCAARRASCRRSSASSAESSVLAASRPVSRRVRECALRSESAAEAHVIAPSLEAWTASSSAQAEYSLLRLMLLRLAVVVLLLLLLVDDVYHLGDHVGVCHLPQGVGAVSWLCRGGLGQVPLLTGLQGAEGTLVLHLE